MHEDQVTVSVATARRLIGAQFPRCRDLPVSGVTSGGTVNALFRVGDRLSARFPLQPNWTRQALESEAAAARDLAALITDLRAVDPRGRRFSGRGRGGDLRDHDAWMETCFRHSEHLLDVPRLRELPPAGPDVMNHGDLIPRLTTLSSNK